jgi:phosphoglycolate phosphatase
MHVFLFDIDGTLIHTRGSGMIALRQAFLEAFGCEPPPTIDTCGRTDRAIASELFQACGVRGTSENWHRFHQTYLRHLADQLPLGVGHVLPGVQAMLQSLADDSDHAIGILTGNTPEGARIKLVHFGIDHHFGFGGYGHEHEDRCIVAEAALTAARQRINGRLHLERVWVIGDTPRDILCARHIGARAVAVATGLYTRDRLADQRPDVLLDDFSQADHWLGCLDVGVA